MSSRGHWVPFGLKFLSNPLKPAPRAVPVQPFGLVRFRHKEVNTAIGEVDLQANLVVLPSLRRFHFLDLIRHQRLRLLDPEVAFGGHGNRAQKGVRVVFPRHLGHLHRVQRIEVVLAILVMVGALGIEHAPRVADARVEHTRKGALEGQGVDDQHIALP